LLAIVSVGFIGFPVATFWLSLWFQRFEGYNALMTGVHMLMGIGAFAYIISFLLLAVQRSGDSYWEFSFPGLCLIVVGADFQFVVTNVSCP
jgi:hypothetical protein